MSETEDAVSVNRKIMELLEFFDAIRVKKDILIEKDYDIDFDQMIYRVEKMVAAKHLCDDFYTGVRYVEFPATTWQMFKETHQDSWWMGWVVRRRPVEYEKEEISVRVQLSRYLKYPDADIDWPKLGRAVPYEHVSEL